MRFKAKLISLDGFNVVGTFEFDEIDYPFNDESFHYHSDELSKSNVSFIQSNYLWVVKKMFPNHLIIDKQGSFACKGHLDFIAVDKNMKVVLEDMFGVVESRKGATYDTQERVWEGIKLKQNQNRQDSHSIPTSIGNGDYRGFGNTMPKVTIKNKDLPFPKEDNKKTGEENKYCGKSSHH